jgi:hypothetical protein
MKQILCAEKTKKSYENFVAYCPYCEFENIYNRVTDLKTTEAIDFKKVVCLNETCAKSFCINGDLISPAFQMLISDCNELVSQKHYSYCILNLTQAFEVFFSLYLRVQLLYKPLALTERTTLRYSNEDLNDLAEQLYDAVKKYAFVKLRNIFLNFIVENKTAKTFAESKKLISHLRLFSENTPSDEKLQKIPNTDLSKLLQSLKNTAIHDIRNKVVHQRAYRPTLDEVNSAINETGDILFPLSYLLKIDSDDINWYLYKEKSRSE